MARPTIESPATVMNSTRSVDVVGTTQTIGPMDPADEVDQQPRYGVHDVTVPGGDC